MNVLSWALYAEGETDLDYLGTLLPRIIQHIAFASPSGPAPVVPEQPAAIFGQGSRSFDRAAKEICDARDAFVLLFVHGDSGGRSQQETVDRRTIGLCQKAHDACDLRLDRCIPVAPRQATEAWCLADIGALRAAFQLRPDYQFPQLIATPRSVEQLNDPKTVARQIVEGTIRGRRRSPPRFPYTLVAQQQGLEVLRMVPSFEALYRAVSRALATVGYR